MSRKGVFVQVFFDFFVESGDFVVPVIFYGRKFRKPRAFRQLFCRRAVDADPVIIVRIVFVGVVGKEYVFRKLKQISLFYGVPFAVYFVIPSSAQNVLQHVFALEIRPLSVRGIGVLIAEVYYVEIDVAHGKIFVARNDDPVFHKASATVNKI